VVSEREGSRVGVELFGEIRCFTVRTLRRALTKAPLRVFAAGSKSKGLSINQLVQSALERETVAAD
jgi:hypothetical protein